VKTAISEFFASHLLVAVKLNTTIFFVDSAQAKVMEHQNQKRK